MSPNPIDRYLQALQTNLEARQNLDIEQYQIVRLTADRANLKLRIRTRDRHLLSISEAIVNDRGTLKRLDYRYHFQDRDNHLIFRYDNTPHFPNLPSFPHHKHLPDRVIATPAPDLLDVLDEALSDRR
jgi:hypothetical protein